MQSLKRTSWQDGLCNESARLGPESRSWPWRDWPTIRLGLADYLQQPADFFRQLALRRHFLWLLKWFGTRPLDTAWRAACPLGVLALRIFTVLISNDADRCIQLRDARLGVELLEMPLAAVAASGWPVFDMLARLAEETRRVSFPLRSACDELDDDGGLFRRELSHALAEGARLPAAQAMRYLRGPGQKCTFGLASAHFALASAVGSGRGSSAGDPTEAAPMAEEMVELMEEGQRLLHEWAPLRRSLYDLITTQWPVWRVLVRSSASQASDMLPERNAPLPMPTAVELVFCGLGWRSLRTEVGAFAEAKGWRLHILRAEPRACARFYLEVAASLRNEVPVIVLSPWLLAWDSQAEATLISGVELAVASGSLQVIGFPTLDQEDFWHFNVWRIQLSDWSLEYAAFPTGYAETEGDRCFRGEATSGTRVFRSASLWRGLVARLRDRSAEAPEDLGSWLVDLDIQARAAGVSVHTCMAPPMREEGYLDKASLTPALAARFHLETARFTAANTCERCLGLRDWRWPQPAVPPPPCLAREAAQALAFAARWWSAAGGRPLRLEGGGPASLRGLLTDGPAAGVLGGRPLALRACCSGRASCAPPGEGSLPSLPGELLARPAAAGLALVSARLNLTLLELRACEAAPAARPAERLLLPGIAELELAPWREPPPAAPAAPAQPAAGEGPQLLLCSAEREVLRGVRGFAGARGWPLHGLLAANASECPGFLRESAGRLRGEGAAVLLSPLLWEWTEAAGRSLERGIQLLLSSPSAEALGFPLLGRDGVWQWSARRIRHQYWKLEYAPLAPPRKDGQGADGVEMSACALADASSGSRVFRSAEPLRRLLGGVEADGENGANWLLDLDLRAHALGLQTLTCLQPGLPEEDYLLHSTLSSRVAEEHQVEAARFLGRRQEHCLPGSNWFAVAQRGLVAPWCFRRDVLRSFRAVHSWWTKQDPANFVVPEEGTFLALFRNGAGGIMPWDSDFDVKLYSEREDLTIESFMNATKAEAFKELGLEAYAYDGCGQDSYVLLRRANITHHIGDAYVRGGQRRADHPWRVRLFGTEVGVGPEHLEHIFFTRYRTPVRKLFGADGLPLQCLQIGHNACLPDCRDESLPCEFEDGFVHVDDPAWWRD